MTGGHWQDVKRIASEALARPAHERVAFAEKACAGDAALLAEVLTLLNVDPADDFLEPDAQVSASSSEGEIGEFELLEEIGHGGMGTVWRARQRRLGRIVAVKLLPPQLALSERDVERFHREARAVAKLRHPGIVPVFVDGVENGQHYFAMEYVAGGDLAKELARQRSASPSDPPAWPTSGTRGHIEAVARCTLECARALEYAHQHGIVHRDVKPKNLLLGDERQLLLVDFGLAKDASEGSITRTHEILGTPNYMSPEQAAGQRQKIDHRTDVYSLGAVLYEMLTLRQPFRGNSVQEVISQVLTREPQAVRKLNRRVPRDLELITCKAMAKDLRERYSSAEAFADDLERFLAHESIVARPPSIARRVVRIVRTHRIAAAALVAATMAAVFTVWWSARAARHRQLDAAVAHLETADGIDPWATADAHALSDARRALDDALRLGAGRSAPERELVRRMTRRLAEFREEFVTTTVARIEAGRRPMPPELGGQANDEAVIQGLLDLALMQRVFPEDERIAAQLESSPLHSQITLRGVEASGAALAGTAWYRPLDQVGGSPGERVDLGPLPVIDARVPAGFYRFVIELDGRPAREFTRLLVRGRDEAEIVARLRPGLDVTAGMVPIAGDVLRLPELDGRSCPHMGREITVAPFLIDRCEVSVSEYREFLEAAGQRPPPWWDRIDTGPGSDRLPAIGMSWFEARDYAEWCGKRLVAHAEWELAARGPDGRQFGHQHDASQWLTRWIIDRRFSELDSHDGDLLQYHLLAWPVDSPRPDGPNGLFHMQGNVSEWSESLAFELDEREGRYVARPNERVILSPPSFGPGVTRDLQYHGLRGPERSYAAPTRGFRCARSVDP